MTQKYTILFDLDGTLVDTAPDLMKAHNHVMKKYGYKTKSTEEIRSLVGKGASALIGRSLWGSAKEEFGKIDGMYLIYYNKDNSMMNSKQIPLTFVNRAYNFWYNINEEHKKGLPDFKQGVSPVQDWNCSYCPYLDHCNPPNRKRR